MTIASSSIKNNHKNKKELQYDAESILYNAQKRYCLLLQEQIRINVRGANYSNVTIGPFDQSIPPADIGVDLAKNSFPIHEEVEVTSE